MRLEAGVDIVGLQSGDGSTSRGHKTTVCCGEHPGTVAQLTGVGAALQDHLLGASGDLLAVGEGFRLVV